MTTATDTQQVPVELPEEQQQGTQAAAEKVNAQGSQDERDAALRKIYAEATRELREAHRDEFNELRRKKAQERGIDWSPEPTKTEKAAAQIRRMLAEDPDLAEHLGFKSESDNEE